ncbi:MAG: hypothetical protein ACPG4Y_09465 [Chitinophagales bacterium]
MNSFFEEIFEYQNEVNQDILAQLLDLEKEIPSKVLDLLSHSINAQKLWNYRILGKNDNIAFVTHSLEKLIVLDLQNFNEVLHILMTKKLSERIDYKSTSGKAYHNTIQEILTQVSQHFQYHRGQIISELLKHHITLKPTDYIYFRRKSK